MPEEIDKLNTLPEEENVTLKEVDKLIPKKVESSNQKQKNTKKVLET